MNNLTDFAVTTVPALEMTDVHYAYPSGPAALRGISMSVKTGEKVGILGLNGSGKSTLLLHTNALLLPDSGKVVVDGIVSDKTTASGIRRRVGMVFQNSDDQLFMPTVESDVAFGPKNMGLTDNEISTRVDEALAVTGMESLRKRPPFQLSGGQKKMVAMATVLSMRPSILVMDEPTSGLDYLSYNRFIEIVSSLPHTLLISTHDISLVQKLCHRAIVLNEGQIIYDGPVENLNYPPNITL